MCKHWTFSNGFWVCCVMDSSEWSYEFRSIDIILFLLYTLGIEVAKANDFPKVNWHIRLKSGPEAKSPVSWAGAGFHNIMLSLWCPCKTTRSLQPQQLSPENPLQPQEVAWGREKGVAQLWLRADWSPEGTEAHPSGEAINHILDYLCEHSGEFP